VFNAKGILLLVMVWLIVGFFVAIVHDPSILVSIIEGPLGLIPGLHVSVGGGG
jgi:hypothetical protein